MKLKVFAAAVFSAFFATNSVADTLSVVVSHSGDDQIGKRLAAEVKNSVRNSTPFHLVYNLEDKLYEISLVTIDPDDSSRDADLRTTYSATLTFRSDGLFDYHMTSMVGSCGSNRLHSCAEKIVQDLSVQHEELVELVVKAGALE